MRPKRRLLKAMRPSRDHPETCGRVGVNFVKSEKRADREPQKRGCLSMARTASCLVPPRVEPAGLFSGFEGLFARLLGRSVSLNSKVRNFRSSKALQRFLRRSVRHKRQHRRQEKPHPRCRRVDGAKGTAELFAPCLYSNPGARGVPFRAPHSTRSLPILLAVAADALINPVVLLFDPAVEGRSGRALTSARPRVIAAETIKRNSDCFRSKGCAQSVADLHDSYPPFDPQRGIAKGILSSTFGRIMHCNAYCNLACRASRRTRAMVPCTVKRGAQPARRRGHVTQFIALPSRSCDAKN
jgi:hypothetical protein